MEKCRGFLLERGVLFSKSRYTLCLQSVYVPSKNEFLEYKVGLDYSEVGEVEDSLEETRLELPGTLSVENVRYGVLPPSPLSLHNNTLFSQPQVYVCME